MAVNSNVRRNGAGGNDERQARFGDGDGATLLTDDGADGDVLRQRRRACDAAHRKQPEEGGRRLGRNGGRLDGRGAVMRTTGEEEDGKKAGAESRKGPQGHDG